MKNQSLGNLTMISALMFAGASFSGLANATIVQFQTSLGDFQVNLYDEATPETVTNFLAYVNEGTYSNTIIHRSEPGFVVQGGGFILNEENKVVDSEALLSPINEPVYSNLRGTIAMAKLRDDPNSATNQWFFNLANNSGRLDTQNGGFTVFGEVVGDGMAVVDAIAALPRFSFEDTLFTALPLRNYTAETAEDFSMNPADYFVLISDVVVLDAAVDTASDLSPTPNTLILQPEPAPVARKKKGGASDWLMALSLLGLAGVSSILRRRRGNRFPF